MNRKNIFKTKSVYFCTLILLIIQTSSNAEIDINTFIDSALKNNNEIKILNQLVDESKLSIEDAYTVYYPKINLKAEGGPERKSNSSSNSVKSVNSYEISLDQTIFDSGKNIQNIAIAKINHEKEILVKKNETNKFSIRAAEAYLNVIKFYEDLIIASEAENNTRIISGQEEVRINVGSGLASDDLNAKRELASAQKKVIMANKDYQNSVYKLDKIFKLENVEYSDLQRPQLKKFLIDVLPNSEKEALAIGLKNNLELKIATLEAEVSKKNLLVSQSNFGPSISLNLSKKYKDDINYSSGNHNEESAFITINMPISNLLSKQPSYKKSKSTLSRSINQEALKKLEIIDKIKVSWQNYSNSDILLKYSENEMLIAKELLSIATKERALNKINARSLLSSEESYRIALTDLSSSRIDLLISAYRLTETLGLFNPDMI